MSAGPIEAVLLFAGQGAQRVGMGKDLAEVFPSAARAFEMADAVLSRSLSSIVFDGPEEDLTRTANCQPALFVHGLALLDVLREKVPNGRMRGQLDFLNFLTFYYILSIFCSIKSWLCVPNNTR